MLLFFEFGMILGLLLGTPKSLECPFFGAKTSSGIHQMCPWPSSHGTLKPEKVGSIKRFRRGKPGIPSFTTGPRGAPGDGKIHGNQPLKSVGRSMGKSIFRRCCLLPKIDQHLSLFLWGKIQFIAANETLSFNIV